MNHQNHSDRSKARFLLDARPMGTPKLLSPEEVDGEVLGRLRLLAKAVKPTFLDTQGMEAAAHFARNSSRGTDLTFGVCHSAEVYCKYRIPSSM